jgi:hypothetical protein
MNVTSANLALAFGGEASDEWASELKQQWSSSIARIKNDKSIKWKQEPPEIHLLVVRSTEINAFATRTDDGYAIAIFDGLRLVLSRLFATLLADPRAFPAIGDISLESESVVSGATTFDSVTRTLVAGNFRSPIDYERTSFAKHLTDLSLRFAFQHELAHILLGHVDLTNSPQPFLEIRPSTNAERTRNHALEMHADETAFQRCFFWILDSILGHEITDPMQFFVNTIHAQLLDFYCATYCLFHLFDTHDSKTHPSSIHRQIRLALVLDYLVETIELRLDHPATEIAGTVMTNVDRYMELILGISWDDRRQETRHILGSQMDETIKPYSEIVRTLYPELSPLAFIPVD